MPDYLPLEEAARQLGIPTDRLVELRSAGEVRGFRDGASWKFPATEIERLKDEPGLLASADDVLAGSGLSLESPLAGGTGSGSGSGINLDDGDDDILGGSGLVLEDSGLGLELADGSGSAIDLAGELNLDSPSAIGSDLQLASDGSDVHLVAGDEPKPAASSSASTSASDSDLALAIDTDDPDTFDSAELKLSEPAQVGGSDVNLGSDLNLDNDVSLSDAPSATSGLSFTADDPEDSGEIVIGADESKDASLDDELDIAISKASSLELMGDLSQSGATDDEGSDPAAGVDVLSELDLLSAENQGSGLIRGESGEVLAGSGLGGSGLGGSGLGSSGLGSSLGLDALVEDSDPAVDDALAADDDLVIADDDDDLVISGTGNDVSVAGDSGINLMSPSDSGLSLESEPLDLAGSSVSALDLGAELSDGSSGGGSGPLSGAGSDAIAFEADEEFQLTPSGMDLEVSDESASQEIEIEPAAAAAVGGVAAASAGVAAAGVMEADVFGADPVAQPVDGGFGDPMPADSGFGDAGFGDGGFGGDGAVEAVPMDDGAMVDTSAPMAAAPAAVAAYEVPFSLLQVLTLMTLLVLMSISGILMTDLVRNIWTYNESSTPVSALTDWIIDSTLGG